MALYNKFGKELDMNLFYESDVAGNRTKELEEGNKAIRSVLYEDGNDTILKVFTNNYVGKKIIGTDYISAKTFEAIKEVTNPNIVKLYDYFYNTKDDHYEIDAYTMEKVHNKKLDILSEEKAILLCYLSDLQNLAKDLANKKISMQDTNGANLLFNSRGPVVVDLDFYFKNNIFVTKKELEVSNKKAALEYFKNYAINNYFKLYDDSDKDEYTRKLNDLYGVFAMRINNKTDIVKCVENNLTENSIAHQLKIKRTN